MLPARNYAHHLKAVISDIELWQATVPKLPERLSAVSEAARQFAESSNQPIDHLDAVNALIRTLETFTNATQAGLHPTDGYAEALWKQVMKTHERIFNNESTPSINLRRLLHDFLKPIEALSTRQIQNITESIQSALRTFEPSTESDKSGGAFHQDLDRSYRMLQDELGQIDARVVNAVSATLEKWKSEIQIAWQRDTERLSIFQSAEDQFDKKGAIKRVLVVEDQEIGDYIEKWLRELLPQQIKVQRARTYEEALSALEKNRRSTLMFLDLGLPRNRQELDSGRPGDRNYGKDILDQMRTYRNRMRVVVVTSAVHRDEDANWLKERGISSQNFILKGAEDLTGEIMEALKRALQSQGLESVELMMNPDDPDEIVPDHAHVHARINDVPIKFAPLDKKIFAVLCGWRWPSGKVPSVTGFYSIHDISENLNTFFGETCDPQTVPQHILTIRRDTIYDTLNKYGRAIDLDSIISESEGNYKLQARRFSRSVLSAHITDPAQLADVLVVENDKDERHNIVAHLQNYNIAVDEASDVNEAVTLAQKMRYSVICLDLHLPLSREEAGLGPEQWKDDAGLDALKQIRSSNGNEQVKFVILTAFKARSSLRSMVDRSGILPFDFISKSDPNWRGKLIRSVLRLSSEYDQGVPLAAGAGQTDHVLELYHSKKNHLTIDGVPMSLTKRRKLTNPAKVIWALAEHHKKCSSDYSSQRLSTEALRKILGMTTPSAVTQAINDTRTKIEDNFFKACGKRIDAKDIILEDPRIVEQDDRTYEEGGYRLQGTLYIRD